MYQRIESMEGVFVGLHIQKDISDPENQELLDLTRISDLPPF